MGKPGSDLVYTNYKPSRVSNANNSVINQQNLTERMYQRHLTELCVNRFKWENMPPEMDEDDAYVLRWLELELFYNAASIFFRHPDNDKFMVGRPAGIGDVNWYDNPTAFTIMGTGLQQNIRLTDQECVPIYANALRTPDTDIVNLYSMKLANLDRTIELNIKNLRYTKVVTVDESQRLTWANLMRKIEQGDPFVLGTTQLDLGQVQALDVGAHPETLPKLLEAKAKMWNECMGLLGLNNANQDKKERLVSDEVSANDEQVQASRNLHLKARKAAVRQINKMFSLNITVRFDDMVDTAIPGDVDKKEISDNSLKAVS